MLSVRRLCVLIGPLLVCPSVHAGSVTNGSFESPGNGCYAGATSLPGWTVGGGNIDIIDASCSGMSAADGTYFVDLTGSHAENGVYDVGEISQTLQTQVGQQYLLSFDFGANSQWQEFGYPNDGPIKSMLVLLNGSISGAYFLDTVDVSTTNPQWTSENLVFTANAPNTTLAFESLNGINAPSDFGPLLDGVNVTPVPLPASSWLMLFGLSGLVPLRCARRKQHST